MADTLYLKHIYPNELPNQKFYFYEGEVDVHFGVIELPRDPGFVHWVQRAWMKGYRLDPVSGRSYELDELVAMLSTESAVEDADEGTDAGRLPAGEDGLREGELPRDESLSEEGLDGSDGDGADVREDGDGPAD